MEDKLLDQDSWAVVEVMGHNTFAGKVSEHVIGGSAFIRVDIPELAERKLSQFRSVWNEAKGEYDRKEIENSIPPVPAFTKLIGASSIYAITPCSEEVAKRVAEQKRVVPVNVIDMPQPKALITASGDDDEDDDEDDLPY
jgi:hypothetical protein